MAIKLSKKDIFSNNGKNDDEDKLKVNNDEKITIKRNQLSYDSGLINGWQDTNKSSLDIINDYTTRINNGEYLSAEDISTFGKAKEDFISSSNNLRRFGKYTDEENAEWEKTITDLNGNYDSVSKFFSKFKSEDDYNNALKANEEYNKKLAINLEEYAAETARLEAENEANKKKRKDIAGQKSSLKQQLRRGNPSTTRRKQLEAQIAECDSQLAAIPVYDNDIASRKSYYAEAEYLQKGQTMTNEYLEWDKIEGNDIGNIYNLDAVKALGQDNRASTWASHIQSFENTMKQYGYSSTESEYYKDAENSYNQFVGYWNQYYGDTLQWQDNYKFMELAPHMEDNEFETYLYYLNTYGTEKADEYLYTIENSVNQRKGEAWADAWDENWFTKTIFGLGAGLANWAEGIDSFIGSFADSGDYVYDPYSSWDYASGMIRESFETDFGKGVYDVANSIGNMAPTIALSMIPVAGQYLSLASTFASSGGNAYEQMRREGYSVNQARLYGALVGGSEAGLQYALNGIGKNIKGVIPAKVVGKVTAGVDSAFKKWAITVGTEMFSEGLEESIQTILEPWFKSVVTGADYDAPDFAEVLYSGLLGMASSFLMGAGTTAINVGVESYQNKKLYGANQQELVDTALSFEQGTKERSVGDKYQQRLASGKNLSGTQLGNLVESNQKGILAEDKSKIQKAVENRLTELGETGNISEIAEIIAKQTAGDSLNLYEKAVLKQSKYGKRVTNELDVNNIASGEYTTAWAEDIGTDDINSVAYNLTAERLADAMEQKDNQNREISHDITSKAIKPFKDKVDKEAGFDVAKAVKSAINTDNDDESKEKNKVSNSNDNVSVSNNGKTMHQGEVVSVQEIANIKNGEVIVKLNNGKEVNAHEVDFSSKEEGLMYEIVADMSVGTANDFIQSFDRGILRVDGKPPISLKAYTLGFMDAHKYGQYGLPETDLNNGVFTSELNESQRKIAYNRGKIDGIANARKTESSTVAKNATTESRQGRVQFLDGGQVKELRSHLTQRGGKLKAVQETAIGTMEKLSAALGVNFYVFESYEKDGKRMYIDEKGVERPAPSGKYRGGSGEIYIDLNAGNQGQGIMLYTVAHELTHFIKDWSPAKFKTMADILMAGYAAQGQSVQELVDNQIAKAKRNGRTIDFDTAYEEVVADSMEAVLASGNVVQMMAEVKQQDQTLWQKICQWFRNLADDLKAMVEAYKGVAPDSREARLVAEVEGFLDTLEMVYGDALMDAGANYQAAGKAEKNTTQEGDAKFQTRNINGGQVVWIENSGFTNAQLRDPAAIAQYIAQHIGDVYRIIESGQNVYIGKDLPGEYTHSKYTSYLQKKKPALLNAKNKASSSLGEMIEIATNRRWEATKHTASKDAKYGMYRYDTKFAFPVKDQKGNVTAVKAYDAELLIRNASNGKKYLYDIVNIKEDTANAIDLSHKEARKGSYTAATQSSVSTKNVAQHDTEVKEKFALRDNATYAEIEAEKMELHQREMELTKRKREAENNPELLQAMDDYVSLFSELRGLLSKKRAGTATQTELDRIEEIKAQREECLQRTADIQERLGLNAMAKEAEEIRAQKEVLRIASDEAWAREGAEKENKAIEKAGLSAPEYFRKKALKAFKPTTNFNEAGYLLPDGKLLNFSGGERNHRYRDHREIGEIYEATQGAAALNRFLNDGNIRIMAESPGIDLSSGIEPTKEQYAAIKRFVTSHGVKERQFFVDFSDAEGHRAGNYAYDGYVNADRVVNDIKYYYENGRVREQSSIASFLYSDRDSDGGELSEEQQEYFRDSKVRDEQGRLLVMYHGTPNGGFTKFRSGTYFTQNPEYADVYQSPGASMLSTKRGADAPMTYKVYLNIKKPFDTRNARERMIFQQEFYRKYGTGTPLADSGLPDWVDGMDLQEFIEEMEYDYDGLILDEGATGGYGMEVKSRGLSYVVFSAEQVKNVENKAPTSDPDIRYSNRDSMEAVDTDSSVADNGIINRGEGDGRVNTDSEGNALTEKQRAFFAQSKARDREGKLLALYHGTANAGFTAFDPGKGRLGGNWFTTSRKDADTYAGNYQHKLFDPDERDEVRSAVGGSYMLGSWMRFDTEADREAFLKQYPAAETIKTDAEYADLMQKADDAGDYDEYERLEEEQLDRRNALKQIQRAYGRYEWEHSREATLQELFDNPEQFSMSDVLRAWDAYDRNNSADEDGATKEELIEALRAIDREGIEQGDDSIADIRFKARLPVGDSGQVVNRANNRTYAVYVNAVNPYEIDARSQTLHGADLYPTIEAGMKDGGYDSVIVRNARVGAHGETGDVVIIKDGGQVKLTSNKAPAEGGDIRFSERDPEIEKVNEVLRKENAELKYDIAHLKELLKLQRQVTGGTKFTRSSVEAAAGQLMKYADARGDKKQLAGLLNHVYEYIAGSKELTWDGVKEAAQPAVDWLRANVVTRKERNSYAQDVLKEIRGSRVYLDEQQKQEVAHLYGSFNDFRKKAMGSIILTDKDAVALDTKWQEWASLWPNIFDPDIASNDMPNAMLEAFGSLRSMTEVDGYGFDEELFAQDLLSQVYDSYWRVSTLRTVADAKQKEINRLKFEHTKRMANLREYHREKTAQLKAEHRESLNKVRQEARERTEQKLKEQTQRHQASREKAKDNRRKTEMRRKIRRTILDLDKLLNKGDKKRHVKEGMKDLVTEVLRSADVLFTDHYSNEDMIRNGVGTELTEQETRYLNEARELMEQIANLPSGSYEAMLERQEQEGKLQSKLSYRMTKLQDVFARERVRLAKAEVSGVLGNLADAYKSLEDSEEGYISGAFHENVYQYLLAVKGEVGGTLVKDMSLNQLDDLYRAYTMVLTTVRNANRMFAQNLKETREVLGGRAIHEIQKAGGEHGLWFPGEDKISTFSWNNQKPVYAFERIGSETLKKLFENTRAGEDTWAQDMAEARGFYLEQIRKHGYDSWDFKKQHRFTSTSGIDFDLNLEQIMSLYAYSKREQAHDHLMKGGFVFDGNTEVQVSKMGIKLTYLNKSAKAHNVSPELLGQIVGKLTAEQKAFVDGMQDYLSTTMGGKGNSISLELYGVKLFNEKHYFPLRSAGQYMERAKEADLKKQQGQISIVNSGFAKSTTPKASNPVVLSGFMDVWADHVNEMSMYHSFVLPMEDFRRVYNYASPNTETGQSVSVNSTIQDAYGEAATNYIDQLYRDLNGGAVSDPRENWAKSWMGKFKKAAVFASASVVVQQPSAIGRAFAIIDPKYFVGGRVDAKRHKALWAELKRFAPVAAIKEMGYFDTGMGKSAQDYIKGREYKGIKEKAAAIFTDGNYRDELLGKAPALADELTWCAIWDAAKRETRAKNPKMDVKSEEFLKKAAQRFTEVIVKTQVYDSVLSRSANMRSKGALMSMWTAFMAEPTTTINMMEDALRKARKGDKGYAARATGAVLGSVILNSALASLVYAMRDDDEDETFLEKYAQSFATEILDGINPLTYYPFLKDVWSALQGFDIERSDMSLITSLAEKATKLVQVYGKDTEGMDEEELAEHGKEIANAWWGVVDYLTALVGIPVKNVRRDINGAFSAYSTISADLTDRDTSWGSMTDKVVSEVKNSIPVIGWLPDKTAADRLYEATVGGDTAYQKRLASSYRTENSLNNAIRKGLRANDSRIWEAAAAWNENDLETYKRIAKEIVAEGHFSQDNVVAAIQAEAKAMLPQESESASAGKAKGYFTAEKFAVAISQGNSSMASIIREDIISTAQLNGKTREEAEKSFASSAKTNVKELFLDGSISTERAIKALTDYCGNTREEASEAVNKWKVEKDYGFAYADRADAYKNGTITASQMKKLLMDVGGKTAEEAERQIKVYDWQKEGIDIDNDQVGVIAKYEEYCENAGIDKVTYYDFYQFYQDSGEEGVAYSKTKECVVYINSLPLTAYQKDQMALSLWAESTVNKYKIW